MSQDHSTAACQERPADSPPRPAPVAARALALLALTLAAAGCRELPMEPIAPVDDAVLKDRAALRALYEATGGPEWYRSDNWLTDAPLGDWLGVATDSAGRVTWLTLTTNNLRGELPSELGDLTELEFLGLERNAISGTLPSELGNAPGLAGLFLRYNRIEGSLPSSFLGLQRLRVVDVRNNRGLCVPGTAAFLEWAAAITELVGPDCSAADRVALEELYSAATGSGWVESAGWREAAILDDWFGVDTDSVGRVSSLDLSANGLSGTLPEAVGGLAALRHLNVSSNGLTGALPRALTNVPLDAFVYAGTTLCVPGDLRFSEWLATVVVHEGTGQTCAPVAEREALAAFYNATDGPNWTRSENWMTNRPIDQWMGVEVDDDGHVVELSLPFNGVRGKIPAELGSLPHLRVLELQGNWGLEGPIPPELFDLSHLRALVLANVGLGNPLPPEIGKLTELRRLELSSTALGGPIPPELGQLVNLRELYLSLNDLVGPIPPEIGNLTEMINLTLWNNELSGEIPPELGNLTGLRVLDLDNNQLTGAIPDEMGNLANLEVLWLNDNELTGPIPPGLGNMANAEAIFLQGNDLSGALPPELGGLATAQELWLGNNPGLSGPLPESFVSLGELETLKAGGTGLCAPASGGLTEWLDGVEFQRVARCEQGGAAVYLTQAVQSRKFPVPLVAGRPALLRVFVSSPQASGERLPPVRATFYHGGAEVHVQEIGGGDGRIPVEIDEGAMGQSANAQIPADVIREGLEMAIEVDPGGTLDSSLGIVGRIPETGSIPVDVREMPDFRLTVIPFLWDLRPDSAILDITADMANNPETSDMMADTRKLLPIGRFDVRRHDPVVTSTNNGFSMLIETETMRRMEGGQGYWLAMVSPVPTGGLLGVAYGIRSWSSFSVASSSTVAHELGHNMGLFHAPCGGPGGPDALYPDANGRIGAWGYDRESGRLVTPYVPDLMSYCGGAWIGDYHFSNSLRHRLDAEGPAASNAPPAQTLLVWGGVESDGRPFLEPALVVDAVPGQPAPGTEYRLTGRTEDGGQAFAFTFDMTEIPDIDDGRSAFVFTLPVTWAGQLSSILLAGRGGSVALDGTTSSPMAILRDRASGQVRAFVRGPEAAAMADGAAGSRMQTYFSRGIPR